MSKTFWQYGDCSSKNTVTYKKVNYKDIVEEL